MRRDRAKKFLRVRCRDAVVRGCHRICPRRKWSALCCDAIPPAVRPAEKRILTNRSQIASAVGSGLASMHLIGRKSESSARSKLLARSKQRGLPISPSSMFASFTSSSAASKALAIASSTKPSRKPMRRSPVKIFTTYWPSRAEVCASRSAAVPFWQRVRALSADASKNSRDSSNAEWFRRGSAFERFESCLAGIAVTARDAAKFCSVDLGRADERAKNHRPAHLQRAQIALRKRPSGKINGGDRQLFVGLIDANIRRADRTFSSFAGVAAIASPTLANATKFRLASFRRICRLVAATRRKSATACRESRERSQRQLQLVFLAQRPRFDPRSRKSRANSAANPCSVSTRFGCTSST